MNLKKTLTALILSFCFLAPSMVSAHEAGPSECYHHTKCGKWYTGGSLEITSLGRDASAEQIAYWKKNGPACHAVVSAFQSGTIVQWYYGCKDGDDDGGPGILGNTIVTWYNGHYKGMTRL